MREIQAAPVCPRCGVKSASGDCLCRRLTYRSRAKRQHGATNHTGCSCESSRSAPLREFGKRGFPDLDETGRRHTVGPISPDGSDHIDTEPDLSLANRIMLHSDAVDVSLWNQRRHMAAPRNRNPPGTPDFLEAPGISVTYVGEGRPVIKFLRTRCRTGARKLWSSEEKQAAAIALQNARCWTLGARWYANQMWLAPGKQFENDSNAWTNRARRKYWNEVPPLVDFFGKNPSGYTMKKVAQRIRAISDMLFDLEGLVRVPKQDGWCSFGCDKNGGLKDAAFVTPVWPHKRRIFLCPRFFKEDYLSVDQSKTLVHECAHLVGMLYHQKKSDGNKAKGENACRRLAKENPKRARKNPDNYAWYFRQFAILDKCCASEWFCQPGMPKPPWRVKVSAAP